MALISLIPLRLVTLADVATASNWPAAFLCGLATHDPQFEFLEGGEEEAFLKSVADTPPPARWNERGVWECVDRDSMLRALYWWLPETPAYALEDLRRYGFSTSDPWHPTNPHFCKERREDLLGLLPAYNKFTMPVPQTTEAWVYG